MSLEKIYFGLLWQLKAGKENFLNSYIVLLSHQPTSTANPALIGHIGCANCLVTQKDNVRSDSFLLPIRVDQNIFFLETCFSRGIFNWHFTVWLDRWRSVRWRSFITTIYVLNSFWVFATLAKEGCSFIGTVSLHKCHLPQFFHKTLGRHFSLLRATPAGWHHPSPTVG